MKRCTTFLLGFALALIINSLAVSVVANIEKMNITVSPINVKVDGQIFQPQDINGNNVLVFNYNGTTYAPLRALAEAYGLQVGYDAQLNLATVDRPVDTKPQPSEEIADVGTGKILVDGYESLLSMNLERQYIDLVKINGNYCTLSIEGPGNGILSRNSNYSFYAVDDLLFAGKDINVTIYPNSKTKVTGTPEFFVRLALTEEFALKDSDNPYFKYIGSLGFENILTNSGVDETIWYSPKENHTPMWWEYNGYTLYNFNEHTASNQQFCIQNGIKYYKGCPCINDIFEKFGINKKIIVGEYEGFTFIEIR